MVGVDRISILGSTRCPTICKDWAVLPVIRRGTDPNPDILRPGRGRKCATLLCAITGMGVTFSRAAANTSCSIVVIVIVELDHPKEGMSV